jgi:hypothetical protein
MFHRAVLKSGLPVTRRPETIKKLIPEHFGRLSMALVEGSVLNVKSALRQAFNLILFRFAGPATVPFFGCETCEPIPLFSEKL